MRNTIIVLVTILLFLSPVTMAAGCQQQPEPTPAPAPTPIPLPPPPDSNTETINEKVSSQLLTQVNLRKEQITEPTPDRLELMENMGMRVDNLKIQRIFIHLSQELITSQIEELESLNIILYLDSWIPPVGAHPTGFILADMPIDKLGSLAEKGYVIRLDTAELQFEPQPGSQSQSKE